MNRSRAGTNVARTVVTALVLAFVSVASVAQQDAASGPQTLFFKANTNYHDGVYDEAAREYERLLESGLESGNLFFNLGNTYFKLGDVGRAIANYERAARSNPADPDLIANLSYARSLTGATPCEAPLWQRAAFPLRGRMSSSSLALFVCGFWTLTFMALIIHRLMPWEARFMQYAAVGFASLTLISGLSFAAQVAVDEWPKQAVIIGANDVAARFEPDDDGTVHFSLAEGSKIQVTETREGWLQGSRCDGRRGWIPSTMLEIL